jgi:hypothetical protein
MRPSTSDFEASALPALHPIAALPLPATSLLFGAHPGHSDASALSSIADVHLGDLGRNIAGGAGLKSGTHRCVAVFSAITKE